MNKKNILVNVGLGESKVITYILPILMTFNIKNLYIVRDNPLNMKNYSLKNINPPHFIKNGFLKTIFKFTQMIFINIKYDIDLIYSINLFPHGIVGWVISRIFKTKYVLSIIANRSLLNYKKINLNFLRNRVLLDTDYLIITGLIEKIKSKDRIPSYLRYIDITKILPGYVSVFPDRFFPYNTDNEWDIITVATLYKIKRIDIFIKIIEEISKKKRIRCLIIGDGPLYQDLKNLVSEKGLIENINFTGKISNKNLNKYYNSAKLFLLTSEQEGLPATLAEAMLTELCVISSNVGLIPNLIDHGKNGFLYPFNNIDLAQQFIINCLKDKNLRKKIGQNARKSALNWTSNNRKKNWVEIFKFTR